MNDRWTIKSLIGRADDITAPNVVELPERRPSMDSLFEQAKSAIREQRSITKQRGELEQLAEENRTRLVNIYQAIRERLSEIGMEIEAEK